MKVSKGVKATMYRLGHRSTKHYLLYLAILLVIGALAVGGFLSRSIFQANTVITQAPAVTHHITADEQQVQHVTKSIFALNLPSSWLAAEPPSVSYSVYSWQGKTGSADAARHLDVYVDQLPTNMAVNRLLPVQANQDHLDVIGATSDNCVNFTDKTASSTQTGVAASKWSGVNFMCDMGNYERDVVATGSAEGINIVTPVGKIAGSRHVLLVYTDNSASPDYTIFTSIVKSFRLM